MPRHERTSYDASTKRSLEPGPHLARIISHLDPTFMGTLKVTLLRDQGNDIGQDSQTFDVKCASPFFGYTGFEFMGNNNGNTNSQDGFNDTQKSYGMWMVPPDVGVTVLVIFVNGDPAEGYWIGCVPSRFANHMVPAIGASTLVEMDAADKKKYNTKQPLPVAEANRRRNSTGDRQMDVEKITKPLHPIVEHFLEQGLLEDDARGTTTSSSRREAPSMVFGISTPGPLDKRNGAKKAKLGTINSPTTSTVPVSRLGGTQFVMDDGDDRYQRTFPAGDGPVNYADVLAGEKGDPTIPYNEYFRVRTRTGHQLLMHNSEDLIYIGNSRGTAWVELTSNGKIDVYAQDSVSVHSENDVNIRADRDINIEAGRNINMRTIEGKLQMDVATNWNVVVGNDGKLSIGNNFDLNTGAVNKFKSGSKTNILSGENTNITAGSNLNLKATNKWMQSGSSYWSKPASGGGSAEVSEIASAAQLAVPLSLHINPSTSSTLSWSATKYQDGVVTSIMKRIPMHEPWALHENQAPQLVTPNFTDRDVTE